MSEDLGKEKQEQSTSAEEKSSPYENTDNPKDSEKDDKETKKEDALEEAKEQFLDTHEKLIEANKDMTKPGNREYLSFYVYQRDWESTKPIGPIIAQEKGPGPAVTNLPTTIGDHDYDVRRPRAPAFKFGSPAKNKENRGTRGKEKENGEQRDSSQPQLSGPGPAEYDTRTLTNKGKENCRAPIVGGRIKSPVSFVGPGPAEYFRGDGDVIIYPHSPAFSMGPRIKTSITIDTPDPGSYTLPSTLGLGRSPAYTGGPAFSMGGRLDSTPKKPKKTPGPGDYELPYPNVNKQRPPAYSMGARISSQNICTSTPGPASNELHLVKFHKPATPRFSFGIRHSPFKTIPNFSSED